MLISASDPVAAALGSALDGLSLRQRIAADNIANMDTPGFLASAVDFEGSLRGALSDGEMSDGDVAAQVSTTTATPGADGNNVDLAAETMTAMQSTFRYQLLTRAVGDRASLVTTAIGGM
jgi:flagellar basal-body rod protein FlgB